MNKCGELQGAMKVDRKMQYVIKFLLDPVQSPCPALFSDFSKFLLLGAKLMMKQDISLMQLCLYPMNI